LSIYQRFLKKKEKLRKKQGFKNCDLRNLCLYLCQVSNAMAKSKTGKHSRYYLYVKFAQPYRFTRDDFTYNSNDGLGPLKAVEGLEKILETTCKDRYDWAKLEDRNAGTVLGFWLPGKGKVTKEQFEQAIKPVVAYAPTLSLKVSVAFLPQIAAQRARLGLNPLETVCVPEQSTDAATFLALYRAIRNGAYAETMRIAYVYRGKEKVAEIRRDDTVVMLDKTLEKEIQLTLAKITISS